MIAMLGGALARRTAPGWAAALLLFLAAPASAGPQILSVEFTVPETLSTAVAVTGCLLGPGWMPSEALRQRQPRSAAELRDALWFQP